MSFPTMMNNRPLLDVSTYEDLKKFALTDPVQAMRAVAGTYEQPVQRLYTLGDPNPIYLPGPPTFRMKTEQELAEEVELQRSYANAYATAAKAASEYWADTRTAMEGANTAKSTPPNKIAASDPRWQNKVAWSSKELWLKQQELETHSSEVAMVFEAVRSIASKTVGKYVEEAELLFDMNFGSPIENNKQKISIKLQKPVELKIILLRELVEGRLKWSADIGLTENTPVTAINNILSVKRGSSEIQMRPPTLTNEEIKTAQTNRSRRKVKL